MMAVMRKLINTKAYKFILWLFLFMMVVGSGALLNIGVEKKWVIKVYQEMMEAPRFETLLKFSRNQKEMYRQKGIILAGKSVEKEAVLIAVSELLKQHEMSNLYISVPESAVEQKIKDLLAGLPQRFFNKNGDFNEEMFLKEIAPQTMDDLLENIKNELVENLFSSIVAASSYNPIFELQLQHVVEFAKKDYSVLKLSKQKFLAKVKELGSVSDETLKKFYKKSKNNEPFKTLEKRSGISWTFDQDNYGINVSQSDIKKEYEKNKNDYLVNPSEMQLRILLIPHQLGAEDVVREKIESLHKQAEANPEKFADLVKNFSEDKASAKDCGLTKLFTQDDTELDRAIVKTAFESLITDGQISVPVRTADGYALLQRVKKNPAQYKDLKAASNSIEDKLKASKFKQRFQQDAHRAISQFNHNPELLEKLIKKGKKSQISSTILKASPEVKQLFKIEEGKYSVFFDRKDGVIVFCDHIEKSKVPSLSEVKEAVLAKYYEEQASELIEVELSKMLQAVRSGADLEKIAKEFGAKLEDAYFENKDEKIEQSSILKNSAVQAKLKALSHEGAVASVVSDGDGLVIRLNKIEDFDRSAMKSKEHFAKTMSYAKKYKVKEGFIASLYRRAKLDKEIEMKQEVSHLLKEA